jgi:Nucleotidyl transferase AbiEii toxin, Type IV TA system
MADPEVLDAEMQQVAEVFGVAMEQVRRDHLISHVLAAISQNLPDRVIFFGGTALSRTYLPDGRLSEDIDLIAVGKRREVAVMLEDAIGARLARTHGRVTWEPEPALLRTDDGLNLRVQLLGGAGYAPWPTREVDLHQRYSDAPPARLTTYTAAAFVADKTCAWLERTASRDLYDLYLLARAGFVTPEAGALFMRHGPFGGTLPSSRNLGRAPESEVWRVQLGGQTRLTASAEEALAVVKRAWDSVQAT